MGRVKCQAVLLLKQFSQAEGWSRGRSGRGRTFCVPFFYFIVKKSLALWYFVRPFMFLPCLFVLVSKVCFLWFLVSPEMRWCVERVWSTIPSHRIGNVSRKTGMLSFGAGSGPLNWPYFFGYKQTLKLHTLCLSSVLFEKFCSMSWKHMVSRMCFPRLIILEY